MEGLLLGTLSYLGKNYSDIPTNNNNNNTIDNYYESNLENNIHQLDRLQAKNLAQTPDFYQQFDSLKFDNVGGPKCINETNIKKSGFDYSLQRDLDFKNGYSNFQDKNMHYGVVDMEHFTHNNMVPFTKKRDVEANYKNASMRFQKHTGNSPFWKHKKETDAFFEPFRDLTYTHGMPVFTEELSNRYIPSSKNNFGNLPFQSGVRVLPGVDNQNSAPYAITRVMPRNVDQLRSEINQKVTYINKPLETIKKGEFRGIDPNITKYKLPSYRETKTSDLVENAGVNNAMAIRGKYTAESQRGEDDTMYTGPATDSVQGNRPDISSYHYTESKRENYENDNTHAITAVNIRPIMTNIHSYTNYENERATTSTDIRASGATNINQSSYYIDRNNKAKTTIKENTIDKPLVSNVNSSFQQAHVTFTDKAKTTIKEQTIDKPTVSNVNSSFKQAHVTFTDKAKTTIKEQTIDKPQVSNINSSFQQGHINLTDSAKQTIKETTINKPLVSNINSSFQQVHNTYTDKAKETIKETTIDKMDNANISSIRQYIYANLNDTAKQTIKETTIDKPIVSNINSSFQQVHKTYTDQAKPTIKETTVIKITNTNITPNEYKGHIKNGDIAKATIKETTIDNNYIGNTTTDVKGVYSNLLDSAKDTIKQTTIDNNYIGGTTSNVKGLYSNLLDNAKDTIKQTTIDNNYIGNTTTDVKGVYSNLLDSAKNTIKQTTIDKKYIGNTVHEVKGTYSNLEDIAKETIKHTTLYTTPVKNIISHVSTSYAKNDEEARCTIKETTLYEGRSHISDTNQSNYVLDKEAEARETLKETTIYNEYIGNLNTHVKLPKSEQAERNMSIDDKREITANFSRPANAKSDQMRGNINADTVRYNDKKQLFGYVSIPKMTLDNNITPFGKVHTDKKTNINDTNDYRMDSIFIDTLKNNPLVNDIYHQKNFDF